MPPAIEMNRQLPIEEQRGTFHPVLVGHTWDRLTIHIIPEPKMDESPKDLEWSAKRLQIARDLFRETIVQHKLEIFVPLGQLPVASEPIVVPEGVTVLGPRVMMSLPACRCHLVTAEGGHGSPFSYKAVWPGFVGHDSITQ